MQPPIARSERGQSAVIVALLLVVLVGMLALAIDGGAAYFNRRAAQNAADAGALAGAREWCATRNAASATNRANEYAITRNGATRDTVQVSNGIVSVSATITMTTAFGAVLGVPEIDSVGFAAAGCFAPGSGTGVLPTAWACPLTTDPVTHQQKCTIPYNHTLVVMDSVKTGSDFQCQNPPGSGQPAGALNCDPDKDGLNEYIAGGNRSWLDLNGGGGGASSLISWINGGFPGTINYHTWIGGQQGTSDSVFQAVANHVGGTFVVPVFDMYCNLQGLPQSVCPAEWNADGPPNDTVIVSSGTSVLYYHIVTFALFHITCVDAGGKAVAEPGIKLAAGGNKCPVEYLDEQAGLLPNSDKTIEGYFVQGVAPGLNGKPGNGVDGGAYTIYLTQ